MTNERTAASRVPSREEVETFRRKLHVFLADVSEVTDTEISSMVSRLHEASDMLRVLLAEVERWESRARVATSLVDTLKAEVERLIVPDGSVVIQQSTLDHMRATVAAQAAALREIAALPDRGASNLAPSKPVRIARAALASQTKDNQPKELT